MTKKNIVGFRVGPAFSTMDEVVHLQRVLAIANHTSPSLLDPSSLEFATDRPNCIIVSLIALLGFFWIRFAPFPILLLEVLSVCLISLAIVILCVTLVVSTPLPGGLPISFSRLRRLSSPISDIAAAAHITSVNTLGLSTTPALTDTRQLLGLITGEIGLKLFNIHSLCTAAANLLAFIVARELLPTQGTIAMKNHSLVGTGRATSRPIINNDPAIWTSLGATVLMMVHKTQYTDVSHACQDLTLPESPTTCPGATWDDWREALLA